MYAFDAQPVNFQRAGPGLGLLWPAQAYPEMVVGGSPEHDPDARANTPMHHANVRMADFNVFGVAEFAICQIVIVGGV